MVSCVTNRIQNITFRFSRISKDHSSRFYPPRLLTPGISVFSSGEYFCRIGSEQAEERMERGGERVGWRESNTAEAAVCVIIRRESELRGLEGGNNRNALAGIPIFRLWLREMGQLINYAAQLFPAAPVSRGRLGEREKTFVSSRAYHPIRNTVGPRE